MPDSPVQRLYHELKHRKVFRVAGGYLVAGWAVIEVAETTSPLLGLPEWVPTLVLLLVLLGFPVAVVLAWLIERTPEGLRRADPGDASGIARLALGLLAATAVAAVVAAGAWTLTDVIWSPDTTARSVAVLPFETLGAERPSAFTEGVHVGVLTRLSNVSDLDVISRTSVLPYRARSRTLPEIARELGVTWVVRGEVQEVGDQVLVNARLVHAPRDRQVWAEDYRRELTATNVFSIQSEIAMRIIDALHSEITVSERARVERTPTRDLDAYRLYVQGRRRLDRRTEQPMRESVRYFERAVSQDSTYALAWVGLADALILLHDYGYATAAEVLPRAEQAVDRALDLDPDLAEAHASRGLLYGTLKRGPAAAREMRRAIQLRPSYAEAHNWASWGALMTGSPELALERAERAVELDPLSPEAVLNLSLSSLVTGQPERALIEARRAQELQPTLADARFYEALIHYHTGRHDQARTLLRGLSVPWAEPGPRLTLALAELAAGDTARALALRSALADDERPFAVGVLHAALGDADAAFAAFDRVDRWSDYWPTLAVRHFYREVWDRLRVDPRYDRLVERVDEAWGIR